MSGLMTLNPDRSGCVDVDVAIETLYREIMSHARDDFGIDGGVFVFL